MIHLHVRSWYSFLAGASSPQRLVQAAVAAGQTALALTDWHSLSGVVQFTRACRKADIKPILGAGVVVSGYPLVLLCQDREGYANLCDLLTLAHGNQSHEANQLQSTTRHQSTTRRQPAVTLAQLEAHALGLICLTGDRWGALATFIRKSQHNLAREQVWLLKSIFPERLFVEVTHHQRQGDDSLVNALSTLAAQHQLPLVATNAVHHATPAEYALYDALTCARLGLTVGDAHPQRPVNNQAYLRSQQEMEAVRWPSDAISNTAVIAALCEVDLLPDSVTPPIAVVPESVTPATYLTELCQAALPGKYPPSNPQQPQAAATLQHELAIICDLQLEEFFLVVREVVQYARSVGIRCSGRGSAANSLVAYLLDITGVDPIAHHLLFERFLHAGRKGMPDIDIDFATHRRSEVIAWMSQRFGAAHTAMTANVITFRLRLAVREMMKVLGYPLCLINAVCKVLPHAGARRVREQRAAIAGIVGESPLLESLVCLVESLQDCPRHLSLHSGGMILSRLPLRYVSPTQTSANGVRQVQFNKDDVEALGLIKFDVLGLRTLSVVTETMELIEAQGDPAPDVDTLPLDDQATFDLIRSGQTLSVFQIESPGQWNLLARSQPQVFDDLVAQVALFRPGPLQGHMVHPYILRRRHLRPVTYPHPSLKEVLKDTYGVILYQEQVLQVAHHFAGLCLEQADEFRRLMSKFRSASEMEAMRAQFVQGAIERHGVGVKTANQVFDLVAKFVGYGFCRSHAAAFARTVYQTAYLKAHHTAAYMAAVMEHKPGFYPLHTVLEEARLWGVTVLPVDVLRSEVQYSLEHRGIVQLAIRVPLTQVKQVSRERAAALVLEREARPFSDLPDLYRRVKLDRDAWDALARAGALAAFGTRREVLWEIGRLARCFGPSGGEQLSLDAAAFANPPPLLPTLSAGETTAWDFATQSITTGPHPLARHRSQLQRSGGKTVRELMALHPGRRVLTAGLVISHQKPPTAKGMTFLLLEDETGRVPTAMTPQVRQKYEVELRAPTLVIEGKLEGAGEGQVGNYRSILIQRLWTLTEWRQANVK